jgi:hypothetical protein
VPKKHLAIALGTGLFLLHNAGVIAGIAAPPAGYEPAYFIRNLDVPQYLAWAELSKSHWLLPDYNAPWKTEPALWQPLFQLVGKSHLPIPLAYYALQLVFYWIAVYALIVAAETFCTSRRGMVCAAMVAVCAIPPQLLGWAIGKLLHLRLVEMVCGVGVVQFAYQSADGLLRGGLSNSFTLSFGTTMILLAFVNLAKYLATGEHRHFYWLLVCLFLDGLFHPFEIFIVLAAAIWPMRSKKLTWLFLAAGLGMAPQLFQTARTPWLRDVSDASQLNLVSPAWPVLVYGLPALMIGWLMLARFRMNRPEDKVLQSWFLASCILPCFPAIPAAHVYDGFLYCIAFLLVRKAQEDQLISRLWIEKPRPMRIGFAAWAAVSATAIAVMYLQIWQDGRSKDPEFLSAVVPRDQAAMLNWMKKHIERGELVLAPDDLAFWAATIPTPSFASHDVFGISYEAQKELADRFYKGGDVRGELIDAYGIRYIVAPSSMTQANAHLLHEEGSLRLYEIPCGELKPYPGAKNIAGAKPKSAVRRAVFRVFEWVARGGQGPGARTHVF